MKFSCKTTDLLQGLQLVSRAISGQQALPILGNVLIEAEGKRCTMSATDLELSIITHFEAAIENEGSITVPAKALLNFAQYTSDPSVVLETSEGTQLKCTSKHSKTLIAGEAATEYPTIAAVERKTAFTLEAPPLLTALHLVTFTCARTTLRPVLSGVYLRTEKDKLILVATDSYRLSEYTMATETIGADLSCIIPVKVLDELKAILGSRKGGKKEEAGEDGADAPPSPATVSVTLSSQQIELQVGPTRLLSRLIDGKFPDYQQIIPKSFSTTATLPARELTTVIKRMHYFAKEVNNSLAFHFGKGSVRIATPQTQLGQDEAAMPAEIDGKDSKIALSSSYLLDFLAHLDGGDVALRVTDSMHPAVFQFPGNERFLHLIMPLRMQEE